MVDPSHVEHANKPHRLNAPEHPSTKGEGTPSSCVGGVLFASQGGREALERNHQWNGPCQRNIVDCITADPKAVRQRFDPFALNASTTNLKKLRFALIKGVLFIAGGLRVKAVSGFSVNLDNRGQNQQGGPKRDFAAHCTSASNLAQQKARPLH
ncbi:MAG: hypothetical protein JXM79_11030 [Sedimentisphaerales bacterium]|nr:hypothetical protein [Sedimentisphaerales bacterium]